MESSNLSKRVVHLFEARSPVNPRTADAALVERCRRGELGAFDELYRQHAGRLYSLAFRMLGHAADAEDAVQDAFLLAHRRLDSFRGEAALGTWLYRLTVNQCLDRLRSRAAREGHATDSLDEPEARREPAGRADSVVERMDLQGAIARLPPGGRAVFVLHDVEGLEHREIALQLGISEGTSKSQLHKARLRLRELLKASPDRRGAASAPKHEA
jgi:RNA polymerase sigma-70 factor, ECF subfamily